MHVVGAVTWLISSASVSLAVARILLKVERSRECDIAGELVIMATTKNTLNAKVPKDLPAKKPVNGGFVIYGRGNVAGDSLPTEGLAFNYSKTEG